MKMRLSLLTLAAREIIIQGGCPENPVIEAPAGSCAAEFAEAHGYAE